jgi:trk system potassium uptake protein TrkA
MGCGRVGSRLARALDEMGHSVAVVDQDPRAFDRLGATFGGQQVVGIGFERNALVAAGVERAHAFAAVSSGDNSNIIAARVARETFGIDNVVARIYDQRRAEVYERLGIPTVASVAWQTDRILRRILPAEPLEHWRSPQGAVALYEVPLTESWVGRRVTTLERVTRSRVAFLLRLSNALLPDADTVLQDGDSVFVLVPADRATHVLAAVAAGPVQEES